MIGLSVIAALISTAGVQAQYTATYLPNNLPPQSEGGQTGTNQCGPGSSQDSQCQNAYINSVTDFCLWAPPNTTYEGVPSTIGETEAVEVAWCMVSGYGTRLIPNGAITGAHFVQTPMYVQVTGVGDLTQLNIPAGDEGGELDPHGATGAGNPVGGVVFGDSYGTLQQYHEWTNFMDYQSFCFRACPPSNPDAALYCNHVYDLLGCDWNMPGNYTEGIFENCLGDSTEPMGIYTDNGTTTTFSQGDATTPDAHIASPSSSCTFFSTISDAVATIPAASIYNPTALASISSLSLTSSSAPTAGASSSGAASGLVPSGSVAGASASGSGTSSASAPARSGAAVSLVQGGSMGPLLFALMGVFGGALLLI